MRDKMHWELRISPSVRRSEIFPIEKHPASGRGAKGSSNGARPGAGFTRGRESFAKTFPLINLVYRWAGSGDACALRSRQNLKYEELSKFTRDAARLRAPSADASMLLEYAVVWPTSIIGKKRASGLDGSGVTRGMTLEHVYSNRITASIRRVETDIRGNGVESR